jgi:hypothetical protein
MQGVWTNSNLLPLERAAENKTLVMNEAEAAQMAERNTKLVEDRTKPTEPTEFFEDRKAERIRGEFHSSLITDPEDGKVPSNPLHAEQFRAARASGTTGFDGPEQRPLSERCLAATALPPMRGIPNNNLHKIVQSPTAVVIHSEEMHDTRVVRLNAMHPPAAITFLLGDAIGWWDGDTLVVESTNFSSSVFLSPHSTLVERFTRVAADEIHYRFTLSDATLYTREWSGENHFMRASVPIYEVACHEGNYSLLNVLSGARYQESLGSAKPDVK